jgi:hypothetical protein
MVLVRRFLHLLGKLESTGSAGPQFRRLQSLPSSKPEYGVKLEEAKI